ncbi:MAG: TIGR02281 family clan AA aspartic protease [Alphaproteobacteria bacterium]|nr:TIGR02281 family clan AA aspartic protease [Alphaproteobacteria bacterium]
MRNIALFAAGIAFTAMVLGNGLSTIPDASEKKSYSTRSHAKHSSGDVVLKRGFSGHFFAEVEVNGTSIGMLADTGASVVALSVEDAEAAGISVDSLSFSHTVSTANGDANAAPVTLDEVTVGSITRHNVPALVARGLSESLLGMSFFNTLSKVAMESDEMVLQD